MLRDLSMRSSLPVLILSVAAAVVVVGCGSSDSSSTSTTSATAKDPGMSVLFAFGGRDASIQSVAGSDQTYSFSMPVNSADDNATWFTDRPVRDAGTFPLTQLTALWLQGGKNGFKVDPPNAAVVYGPSIGVPDTMIAKMSDAKIVDGASGSGELFQATLTVVPEVSRAALAKSARNLATHARRSTAPTNVTAAQTSRVTVFVDMDEAPALWDVRATADPDSWDRLVNCAAAFGEPTAACAE